MYPEQQYNQGIRQKDSLSHAYDFTSFLPPTSTTKIKGRSQRSDTIHFGTVNESDLLMTDLPSVQFSRSVVSYSVTPWTAACQASLSVTNSWSLLKLMSMEVGDALQPSHPLSSPSPPAFSLSQHRVFSSESVLHIRWPKYWSFSFNISPSNEYSRLISFRMDRLDLVAVQGTLKESSPTRLLLQHHFQQHSLLYLLLIHLMSLGESFSLS